MIKNQRQSKKLDRNINEQLDSKKIDFDSSRSKYIFSKWFLLGIILITVAVYVGSLENELTNWDDKGYITENQSIKHFHNDSVFSTIAYFMNPANPQMGNYHPLTMITYALEYSKFGLDPKPYHTTNLIIHLLSSIFTFYFVRKLTKNEWIAFMSALIFAIHPMHVESVAWVSERKDVLYGFFYIAGLYCYVTYLEEKTKYRIFFYLMTILLFLFSGLSKGMAVSLPIAFFAIDYYLKRKISIKFILEKVPHFIVAIILGVLALKAQESVNAIGEFTEYPFADRLLFTFYGITVYLGKFFLPINLSCFYDYPTKGLNGMYPLILYLGIFVVVFLTYLMLKWRKSNRTGVFALTFFFITIALVLQILPVGEAIIAERYTYIPYIGIAIVFSEYIYNLSKNSPIKNYVLFSSIGFFCFLTLTSYQRTKVWRDSISLWNDAISKDKTIARQYKCRGDAHMDLGTKNLNEYQDSTKAITEYNLAIKDYDSCISLNPRYADAFFNQGLSYQKIYDISQEIAVLKVALKSYELAIKIKQSDSRFFATIGLAYFYLKDYEKAISNYSKAIEMDPFNKDTYNNRVGAYFYLQKYNLALKDALKAQSLGYPMDPIFIESLKKQVQSKIK
jgi:hypothetical protein